MISKDRKNSQQLENIKNQKLVSELKKSSSRFQSGNADYIVNQLKGDVIS